MSMTEPKYPGISNADHQNLEIHTSLVTTQDTHQFVTEKKKKQTNL